MKRKLLVAVLRKFHSPSRARVSRELRKEGRRLIYANIFHQGLHGSNI